MTVDLPTPAAGVATGIGSMPGTDSADFAEATRVVFGELPDLPHLPEMPGRSEAASMTGRTVAMLADLGADLQPAGWRLTDAPGADHRRARSLLAQDLDVLEEHAQGHQGWLKLQAAGPWTLAATVERPRGDRLLADRGARRELAQSLAEGLREHVAQVQRRLPGARIVVQLDEPALPAVLSGSVRTASGFHRHRSVTGPQAVEALGWVCAAVVDAGAVPVAHCCSPDVPLATLQQAGMRAVSVDAALVASDRFAEYAALVDAGIGLWLGVVPSTDPETTPTDTALVRRVQRLLEDLDVDPAVGGARVVVTPGCGLAGASARWARHALALSRRTSHALSAETDTLSS